MKPNQTSASPRKLKQPHRRVVFKPVCCILAALGMLASIYLARAQDTTGETLKTVAQVRSLTSQQAAGHLPVRVKGVVTFWDAELFSRFIQDDTAGIYIGDMTNLPALKPGQLVEIEGVTGPGEFAPIIVPSVVKVVGEGKLPAVRSVSVEELLTGQQDSQLVEVSGLVRSVKASGDPRRYEVELVMGGERFTAFARDLPVAQMEELVDSTVTVRGVASTLFNRQRQLLGFRILVPKPDDMLIKVPAPAEPFKVEAQSVDSLLQFSQRGTFGHRVKVAGTVIYHEPGSALFIQDDKEGVQCQTRDRKSLKPGDRVEVLGFPAKGEYTPILQDATYRKVGDGTPPVPAALSVDEILTGSHDARLIQITGNLLERAERGRERFLVLEHEGFIFHAYLGQDIASGAGFPAMHTGSEVQVAGICLVERGANWQAGENWRANSFRLLLRSPDDVRVQKTPPWWVRFGVGRIIGILAVIILIAVLRILYLHRHIDTHLKQQAK